MFFLIVHGNIALGGCEKLLLQLDRLRNNIKERKYLMFVLNVFENFSHDMEKSISWRVCPCLMGTFNENLILSIVWRSQKHNPGW